MECKIGDYIYVESPLSGFREGIVKNVDNIGKVYYGFVPERNKVPAHSFIIAKCYITKVITKEVNPEFFL